MTVLDRTMGATAASPATCNVAAYLPARAREMPDRPALVVTDSYRADGTPAYSSLTFAALERLSNRYAQGLANAGFERGMRVLLMVRPGQDFVALVFALFKMGAVPVMIDPGMGLRRLLDCVRGVDPQGFIGIPLAQAVRVLRPGAFRSIRQTVTVGRRWFWGGASLDALAAGAKEEFEPARTRPDEVAAILFTSGSTGPAKGVVYEHGMFDAQVRMIQAHYDIVPGEVDLPAFPLFVLFSTAMGMTAVIPDMNPSRPASVNPARLVRAMLDHEVTSTFGSPAIWNRVGPYCAENSIRLPAVRRVLIAGAPVSFRIIETLRSVLSNEADVHTPYGATEALPLTSIGGKTLLADCAAQTRRGAGTCVGMPLPDIDLRLMRISDESITHWSDDLQVPDGEYGEVVVSGPVVTKAYYGQPRADALAKIADGERTWHRMGDIGYRDDAGRLWFCGRKSHRVQTASGTLFTDCCEPIFNEHPAVFRTALVGIGDPPAQRPVIVAEPLPGRFPRGPRRATLAAELLELGSKFAHTRGIADVLFHRGFPVDVRHNAKIDREQLAAWATRKLR